MLPVSPSGGFRAEYMKAVATKQEAFHQVVDKIAF